MTLLVFNGGIAQGNGIGELRKLPIWSLRISIPPLIYAIGAVIGLIGGVKFYSSSRQATRIPQRLPPAGSVRVSS